MAHVCTTLNSRIAKCFRVIPFGLVEDFILQSDPFDVEHFAIVRRNAFGQKVPSVSYTKRVCESVTARVQRIKDFQATCFDR